MFGIQKQRLSMYLMAYKTAAVWLTEKQKKNDIAYREAENTRTSYPSRENSFQINDDYIEGTELSSS